MSIPRATRDQYLKPGACKWEGCTATWDEGPRNQKYCVKHQKAWDRRYARAYRKLKGDKVRADERRRRQKNRLRLNALQRWRYAARKANQPMHSRDGEQAGSVIVS